MGDDQKPAEESKPPGKKPFVSPIVNLTQEQLQDAVREGLEESDRQSASIRRDLEVYERNKKKETEEKKQHARQN